MVCSGKDATRIRQISFDCCYLPVHSSPGAILDEAHFRFNTGSFCLEDANILTYTTQAKPKAMVPTPPAEPPPGWATQLILVAYL